VWRLTADGRRHRVEADLGGSRRLRWYVDDELVAERRSSQKRVVLQSPAGRVQLRFGALGGPRRATLLDAEDGADLVPDEGSAAARHEERVRAHPERYALIQAAGAAAKLLVPLLLTTVAIKLAIAWHVDVPLPDLPSVRTPDMPSVPLPDLPDWDPPGWVERVLAVSHYIWPVALAYVIARREIRRRRHQDQRRGATTVPDGSPPE
jgi:hypothetical protein